LKAQINLASEPFRRDRLFLVSSGSLAALLALSFIVLAGIAINDRAQMQASLAEMDRVQRQLVLLNQQQMKLDSELRQAGNADVLERSVFINTLISRKGISWTRMFADLGKVLPPNARLISIRPQVDAQDHVALDLLVGAESEKPLIDLLAHFEGSDNFGSTSVSAILPPSQTDPLYRYRVSVNYAQKL